VNALELRKSTFFPNSFQDTDFNRTHICNTKRTNAAPMTVFFLSPKKEYFHGKLSRWLLALWANYSHCQFCIDSDSILWCLAASGIRFLSFKKNHHFSRSRTTPSQRISSPTNNCGHPFHTPHCVGIYGFHGSALPPMAKLHEKHLALPRLLPKAHTLADLFASG